jgi:PAS domain S-box-containing protein
MAKFNPGLPFLPVLKRFIFILTPLALLLVATAAIIYKQDMAVEFKLLAISENKIVVLQQDIIKRSFKAITSHLLFLAELDEFHDFFETRDPSITKEGIAKKYLSLSKRFGMYDQIRFIDETGAEIIRVNHDQGRSYIVPDGKLQNKANRYYFNDTLNLNKGEIFVSPFDLNIEKGKIETPQKPMIRFGTPLFDRNEKKRGIVILNYYGKVLIDALKEVSKSTPGDIMLVNSDGYWLLNPNPELEWGFMFSERKEKIFQSTFPEAWKKILTDEKGQFSTAKGLFTYKTIYPLLEGWRSSSGSGEAFSPSRKKVDYKEYYWKIISSLAHDSITARPNKRLLRSLSIYIIGIFIIMIGSFYISLSLVRRKKDKQAVQESEARFRAMVETTSDWIWAVDKDGVYIYASPKVEDLLGYTPEEVVGKTPFDFMPPDEAKRMRDGFRRSVKSREPIWRLVNQNLNKGGALIWLETSSIPVFDSKGNLVGYRGIDRDITQRRKVEAERERLINQLQNALDEVKTLGGLLPICASCKKIRDDKGYWNQIEFYLKQHTDAEFSHSLCPKCAKKLYPGLKVFDNQTEG